MAANDAAPDRPSISERSLMRLAMRAAIELERAKARLDVDPEPILELSKALRDAAKMQKNHASLSVSRSGSLQPYQRLFMSEMRGHEARPLERLLSANADLLASANDLNGAPETLEQMIQFCNGLHKVLRAQSRAEREAHGRGRDNRNLGGSSGRRIDEDAELAAPS